MKPFNPTQLWMIFILLFIGTGSGSAQTTWTWSVSGSEIHLGSPDTLEVILALKCETDASTGALGNFNIQGTFPESLYGFDSEVAPKVQPVSGDAYEMSVTPTNETNVWQVNGFYNESQTPIVITSAEAPICYLKFAIRSSDSDVQLGFINLQETYASDNLSRQAVQYDVPASIPLMQSQMLVFQSGKVEMVSVNLATPDTVLMPLLAQHAWWFQADDGLSYSLDSSSPPDLFQAPHAFRLLTNASENDTLYVPGYTRNSDPEPVPIPENVTFWLGSPYTDDVALQTLFTSIADQILFVRNDDGLVWIPDLGVDELSLLRAGEGVEVQLNTSATFLFPESETLSGQSNERMDKEQPSYFHFRETGLPATFVLKQKGDAFLENGDEIGLFDGETCVGGGVYSGEDPLIVTAWEALPDQSLPGFQEGPMAVHRWNQETGEEVLMISYDSDVQTLPSFQSAGFATVLLARMPSAVEEPAELPTEFLLEASYPNPFNPVTHCNYHIPANTHVRIAVYDALGKEVKVLTDEKHCPGVYSVQWDGTDAHHAAVASGIYILRLDASAYHAQNKVMLIR